MSLSAIASTLSGSPTGTVAPAARGGLTAIAKNLSSGSATQRDVAFGKQLENQSFQKQADQAKATAAQANSPTGILSNTLGDLKSKLFTFTPKAGLSDMLSMTSANSPFKAAEDAFSSTVQDTGKRLVDSAYTLGDNHASALQKGVAVGEAGMGLVNAAFTPITVGMAAMSKYPVVGHAADMVNNLFGQLGKTGAAGAEVAVSALPVSESTKKTILPLAQELGALAAQIIAGKVGGDYSGILTSKSKAILDTVNNDVSTQLKIAHDNETRTVPVSTPNTRHAAYAQKMGYEPYTPTEDLPIIKSGPKAKGDTSVPTIQAGVRPSRATGGLTYEPVEQGGTASHEASPQEAAPVAPSRAVAPAKPAEAVSPEAPKAPKIASEESGLKTSKVANSIEQKAIETGLADKFNEKAGYTPKTVKAEAAKVADLVANDPERMARIVRGGEKLPNDMSGAMFIKAVEEHATRNGDVSLLRDLAKSNLVSETSAHAQELRFLAERDQASAVQAMKEIQATRRGRVERTVKNPDKEVRAVREAIKKEIRKPATRQAWADFVKELQC